ncbi:Hypothetical Protein FCC1311_020052 [Hondaea fermentalgiana]|uniref:Aminoglycoside phosphotransferase domain-containing protein n=1 Tax=Hondaea fermentalgiana TaxID=2315210 RepID=A0A2R5G427_9STRA|nr:Hypothetical Protein FCC1311_020052 [Hondaea fermentalgiana]|eukprot:GBG25786.1 Hypothetical Protein FCC1311_020052 [Hondaea fermentalgiana]
MSDEETDFEVVRGYDEERADPRRRPGLATANANLGEAARGAARPAAGLQQEAQQQEQQQRRPPTAAGAHAPANKGKGASDVAAWQREATELLAKIKAQVPYVTAHANELMHAARAKLAAMGKLAELAKTARRPQGSSGNLFWLDDPTPQAPEHWQIALHALQATDALLALAAWKMGARVLALTMSGRLAGHIYMAQQQVVREHPGEGGLATTVWAVTSTLQRLLLRLARRWRQRTGLHLVALFLGHLQLLVWGLTYPRSVLGKVWRSFWMTARTLYVEAARKIRLQGTFALPSRAYPTKASEVNAQWLSKTLGHSVVRCEVSSNEAGASGADASATQVGDAGRAPEATSRDASFLSKECERLRLTVRYADSAADAEGSPLPEKFEMKLPVEHLPTKLRLRLQSAAQREIYFYTKVAPRATSGAGPLPSVETPRTFAAHFNELSSEFCLLFEDTSSLQSLSTSQGASWQQACSFATRYARFHAVHWRSSMDELDRDLALGWHASFEQGSFVHPLHATYSMRSTLSQIMENAQIAASVSAPLQRALRSFVDHWPVIQKELCKGPMTLIHANCQAENLLFPGAVQGAKADRPCHAGRKFDDVLDRLKVRWLSVNWQASSKGKGAIDLASFIGLNLDVASEPKSGDTCDRMLVAEYHKALAKALGQDGQKTLEAYSADDCWRDYRLCLFLVALTGLEMARDGNDPMLRRVIDALERTHAAEVLSDVLSRSTKPRVMSGALTTYRHVEDKMLARDRDGISMPGDRPGDAPVVIRSATPQDEPLCHILPSMLLTLKPGNEIAPGAGRRDAYDRWFLNGYSPDGKVFFAVALGFYPGRGAMDAAISVVLDGKQHNLRVSRHLGADTWPREELLGMHKGRMTVDSAVGPIRISIVKPLEEAKLEVIVPGKMEVSLTMRARFEPTMEPPYDSGVQGIGEFNYERFTQLVAWEGSIKLNGSRTLPVRNWWGSRDRSWGRRPHLDADRGATLNAARSALLSSLVVRHALNLALQPIAHKAPQFYWFWTPINVPNGGFTYHSQQRDDGSVENGAAHVFGDPFGPEHAPYGKVEAAGHSLEYQTSGARHFRTCTIIMVLQDGRRVTLTFEPVQPFFMSGVGYGHDSMSHGARLGPELVVQSDSILTELADRNHNLHLHVQEVCLVRCELYARDAGPKDAPLAVAHGISGAEQYVLGPHKPSGFVSVLDV